MANTEAENPAPESTAPACEVVDTLSTGVLIKRRLPRMRACNERDAKGKVCAGHLKRWYFFGDELAAKFGKDAEVYAPKPAASE